MVTVDQSTLDSIAERLGMPAGSTVEELHRRAEELNAARQDQVKVAASRQQLVDDNKRLVNAAYNDGRIRDRELWLRQLNADPVRNRPILASLSPGLRPAQQVVEDEALGRVEASVLGRLGMKPPPVEAAAYGLPFAQRPSGAPGGRPPSGFDHSRADVRRSDDKAPGNNLLNADAPRPVDSVGLPITDVPAPVRISRGTPPEQWTERQRQDAALRRLGPRFHPGTQPPPSGDVYYQPSPNDHSIYV